MRGGRERRGGEDILYNGIRYRIRFEASDRTTGTQKAVQVSRREGQSGVAGFCR